MRFLKNNGMLIIVVGTVMFCSAFATAFNSPSNTTHVLFEGLPNNDAPSVASAQIVSKAKHYFLEVTFQDPKSFPSISTEVKINNHIGLYEIERLDTHEKLEFVNANEVRSYFVCSNCLHDKPGQLLPVQWIKS